MAVRVRFNANCCRAVVVRSSDDSHRREGLYLQTMWLATMKRLRDGASLAGCHVLTDSLTQGIRYER